MKEDDVPRKKPEGHKPPDYNLLRRRLRERSTHRQKPRRPKLNGIRLTRGEGSKNLLSKPEELKLTLAAGRAMAPTPFCEGDVEPVIRWARRARSGQFLLDLTLEGRLLPVGIKDDGEIAFRTVGGTLSATEAKQYRADLKQIETSRQICEANPKQQARGKIPEMFLSEPDEARLRLAVSAAVKWAGHKVPDVSDVFEFAKVCRKDETLLRGVLDGNLLPLADSASREVTFRRSDELSAEDLANYRAGLQRIAKSCV